MSDIITVVLVSSEDSWESLALPWRPLLAVSPQVFPHVPGLYEGLGTDRAGVFPLASVGGRVTGQVGLLHEGFPAVLTDELLLPQVGSQVVLVDGVGAEPLLAVDALVLLLPGVEGDVLLQIGFLGEGLPTEGAEPGLGELGVFAHFVIPQCGGGEVGLVALVAPVAPAARVLSHVELQAVLTLQSLPADRADEVFLRGVLDLVLLQLVPVPTPLPAHLTLRYLREVAARHNTVLHSLVPHQVLIDLESLVAALHITGVSLQLLVDHLVCSESVAGGEVFLGALLTRVNPLVVRQIGLYGES